MNKVRSATSVHVNMVMNNHANHDDIFLKTYTITCIATACFTGTSDFDDLGPPKTIISRHRISQLYSGKLGLLQPTE
jgi:hypothetical protein